jgi:hypothetical protein
LTAIDEHGLEFARHESPGQWVVIAERPAGIARAWRRIAGATPP